MPGPPPKDPEQRRRRNKPSEFESLPAAGYSGPAPALPAKYRCEETVVEYDVEAGKNVRVRVQAERKYLAATREWYRTWATSPQATRFTGTDWQRLVMLAPLVDEFHRTASREVLSELRLQEERLGATWGDRQRLRVRIDDAEPEADEAPERPAAAGASADRRARLRAV